MLCLDRAEHRETDGERRERANQLESEVRLPKVGLLEPDLRGSCTVLIIFLIIIIMNIMIENLYGEGVPCWRGAQCFGVCRDDARWRLMRCLILIPT